MKFQTVGSNYDFTWAMRQLTTVAGKSSGNRLASMLEQRYGGHAYLYSKGRNALSQAVRLSIDSGASGIAVNGLTCSVVVDAVESNDAVPIYLDVDPSTAHFSVETLEATLAKRDDIAAVIIQNTYGRMVDIAPVETLAREHNIILIEDLAHSIGQTYADGREAGTVGDLVMISFGRDKLLDTVNGGALIIRSPQLHMAMQPPRQVPSLLAQFRDRIYPLLSWMVRKTYSIGLGKLLHASIYALKIADHSSDGGIMRNERLPYWQAALAARRFRQLDALNAHRREIMGIYEKAFGGNLLSLRGTIRAALLVDSRTQVFAALRNAHYELNDTWYDAPIGPQRKYQAINYPEATCPHAVKLSMHTINLPTHSCIAPEDARNIVKIVEHYV